MSKARLRALLLSLLILGGLLLSGSSPVSIDKPDKVEIEISQSIFLTLTDSLLVQQLYESLLTLPLNDSSLCANMLSLAPIYHLTFSHAGQTVLVTTAQERGCPPVSRSDPLGAYPLGFIDTAAFWGVLARAVSQAFSSFQAQQLVIGSFPSPDRSGRIAWFSSPSIIHRLYEALLNSPELPSSFNEREQPAQCQVQTLSEDRLLFSSGSSRLVVFFSPKCQDVSLGQVIGGLAKQQNEQFQQTFAQTVEQGTFSQAEPTQLIVETDPNQQTTITNLLLIRRLYGMFFSLSETLPPQQCSAQQSQQSSSYMLRFLQRDLPIMTRYVTAGACNQITVSFLGSGSQPYFWQGNEAFWKLLRQVTK